MCKLKRIHYGIIKVAQWPRSRSFVLGAMVWHLAPTLGLVELWNHAENRSKIRLVCDGIFDGIIGCYIR